MIAGVFRHSLPGLFILVSGDKANITHTILRYLQRFGTHDRHPQRLQTGLVTNQADVSQEMIAVVGITGDMRHRLPITQFWYCFWKQTITRSGLAIIFWKDFPDDDPGIDP